MTAKNGTRTIRKVAGGGLTNPDPAVAREVKRLERFARAPWFAEVAPPQLRGGMFGGAPDLAVKQQVSALFAQRDLGTLRGAVDGVREAGGWAWIDETLPPPVFVMTPPSGRWTYARRGVVLRACLVRLEHLLAQQVRQEAWS